MDNEGRQVRLFFLLLLVLGSLGLAVKAGPPKPVPYREIPDLADDAERHIVVKAEDRGSVWSLAGFLNCWHVDMDFETVAALKPKHWRYDLWPFWNPRSISIADEKAKWDDNVQVKGLDRDSPAFWGKYLETMLRLRETGMTWQIVLHHKGPYYEVFHIKQDDLKDYYDHIYTIVKYAKHMGIPIDYWEIWNEPDVDYFWQGTEAEWLAVWDVSYDAIRAAYPEAKIVGPSYGRCDVKKMEPFLKHCKQKGQRVDALSWHEGLRKNAGPDRSHKNIEEIRNLIETEYMELGVSEYHIDEWGYTIEHTGPGTQVAYFYYLDLAGVDRAAKAHWTQGDLDGIMVDAKTPRTSYWVWKEYSKETGVRLITETNDREVVAIASRDDEAKVVRAIIGRSKRRSDKTLAAVRTKIEFKGLPVSGNAEVTILKLGPDDGSLLEKELAGLTEKRTVAVDDGELALMLDSVLENQVYSITIAAVKE